MSFVNVISFILFMFFLSSYSLKLVILKKKSGVQALLLAKGNKGRSIDFSECLVRVTTFL